MINESRKMKTMNFKNIIYVTCAVCGLSACADWDDHYDADSSVLSSQQQSLWHSIEQDAELSQFASLLKKVNFDKELRLPKTYTIWAPKNDSYDFDALSQLSDSALLKSFVQNHISQNNVIASGKQDNQRVFMLNRKMMLFNGDGSYTIRDVNLDQANIACNNGTLHKLSGKIDYLKNIH
jgi:uncharacterized surface protein with fasciclin (FAS1) repeats